MPKPSTLVFDGRLTDFSVAYKNAEMIQDAVMPPKKVPQKNYTYFEQDQAEAYVLPDDMLAEDGEDPNEVDIRMTQKTGLVKDYGYSTYINNDDVGVADLPIDIEQAKVEDLTTKCVLKKEIRVAQAVLGTANYHANNQNDEAGLWANPATLVMDRLVAGARACWKPPTDLVLDLLTLDAVCKNTQVLSVLKGTLGPQDIIEGGKVNPSVMQNELGKALGVRVHIGKARYLTAKKGQTPTYGYVWGGTNAGKGGAAFLRIGTESLWDVHTLRQFQYRGREIYRRETGRGARGGQKVRCVDSYQIRSISTIAGYLFVDTLVT